MVMLKNIKAGLLTKSNLSSVNKMCVIVHACPHLPSGFWFMTLAMVLFSARGQTIGQHLKT